MYKVKRFPSNSPILAGYRIIENEIKMQLLVRLVDMDECFDKEETATIICEDFFDLSGGDIRLGVLWKDKDEYRLSYKQD